MCIHPLTIRKVFKQSRCLLAELREVMLEDHHVLIAWCSVVFKPNFPIRKRFNLCEITYGQVRSMIYKDAAMVGDSGICGTMRQRSGFF